VPNLTQPDPPPKLRVLPPLSPPIYTLLLRLGG
jgi:hypothetical protein